VATDPWQFNQLKWQQFMAIAKENGNKSKTTWQERQQTLGNLANKTAVNLWHYSQ
jgi:hypothetical protein